MFARLTLESAVLAARGRALGRGVSCPLLGDPLPSSQFSWPLAGVLALFRELRMDGLPHQAQPPKGGAGASELVAGREGAPLLASGSYSPRLWKGWSAEVPGYRVGAGSVVRRQPNLLGLLNVILLLH